MTWSIAKIPNTRIASLCGHRLISDLFFLRCPTTIRGFVIAIVVNTINRVLRRWFTSHIGEKINKVFSPSVAYGNSPASISFISCCLWISAAMNYSYPCFIFRTRGMPRCISVASLVLFGLFWLKTPAAKSASSTQGIAANAGLIAAQTTTKPFRNPRLRGGVAAHYRPSTDFLASQIYQDSRLHRPLILPENLLVMERS